MNVTEAKRSQADDRLTRRSLFLGVIVWFTDLNIVYALPSVACKWGWFPFRLAGIPGLVLVEGLVTLISLALMLYLIYLPWRNWRAFQAEKTADRSRVMTGAEQDRRALMAFVTMLLNGFFFLFLIAFFVPMLALNACVIG